MLIGIKWKKIFQRFDYKWKKKFIKKGKKKTLP